MTPMSEERTFFTQGRADSFTLDSLVLKSHRNDAGIDQDESRTLVSLCQS